MAEVVVFHHALGLTDAMRGFADDLLVYPGSEHYFAEHDAEAAALLKQRVLDFLVPEA